MVVLRCTRKLLRRGDVVMATTNDRRVLGTMNDLAWMAEGYLQDLSLHDATLELAEAPRSPLGMKNPRDATLALPSAPTLRLLHSQ